MRKLAAISLVFFLFGGPVQAQQSLGMDVPGEGIVGDFDAISVAPQPRLEVQELQKLGLENREPEAAAEVYAGDLPPIFVTVSQVVTERVPVASAPPIRRRRSLASRGAHNAVPQQSYKTVRRRVATKLDITPIIVKKAEKYKLDPWLVRGVIEVESAFRPHAVSSAGAGGLMQLMPGTASYLGCRDRFDPEQNIEAGARYLRMMLDRFGDETLAIAAYNAGPGNVERHGGIPPFAETQRYVVKVKRAWKNRGQR